MAERVLVRPAGRWELLAAGELWRYRELLFFLAWRDLKLRYRQTALGVAWAILQPLATMVVFTIVFGRLAKMPSDGVPYLVWSYVGLLPWMYFSHSLGQAAMSLVNSANLVTKVYFPRMLVPVAAALAGLVDLAAACCLLPILLLAGGVTPHASIALLPLLMLFAVLAVLGTGIGLAALNVAYRDVRYVVPFLTQLWLFLTPVAYPSSLFPEPWRTLSALNPMVGVVEGFRWAVLGVPIAVEMLTASLLSALALIVAGAAYFQHVEAQFADVI